MTPDAPTWNDVTRFLTVDEWREVPHGGKRQRHIFWEKDVDGRVLQTHTSHSGSTGVGASRFGIILREQLEVTRQQFWETVRTGRAAPRPAPVEAAVVDEIPLWAVMRLMKARQMSESEIGALGAAEAARLATDSFNDPA